MIYRFCQQSFPNNQTVQRGRLVRLWKNGSRKELLFLLYSTQIILLTPIYGWPCSSWMWVSKNRQIYAIATYHPLNSSIAVDSWGILLVQHWILLCQMSCTMVKRKNIKINRKYTSYVLCMWSNVVMLMKMIYHRLHIPFLKEHSILDLYLNNKNLILTVHSAEWLLLPAL